MVCFDSGRRTLCADRFDNVWIERALCKELRIRELLGLNIEQINERTTNDLALALRIIDAIKTCEEEIRTIDKVNRHREVRLEHLNDIRALS